MSTFKQVIRLAALAAIGAVSAAQAGTVDVKFIEPQKFSDAGRGSWNIEQTTKSLAQLLQAYGKKLPEGQALKIEVTDVDLAGEMRFTRHGDDVRVTRGRADWPRIELRYTLSDGSRVLKSGEARIADMAYQQHALHGSYRDEAYGYEHRMLDRWFAETFPTTTASR
jgi:hypothetical protein